MAAIFFIRHRWAPRLRLEAVLRVVLFCLFCRLGVGRRMRMPGDIARDWILSRIAEGIRVRTAVPAPPLPQASPKAHAAARPRLVLPYRCSGIYGTGRPVDRGQEKIGARLTAGARSRRAKRSLRADARSLLGRR